MSEPVYVDRGAMFDRPIPDAFYRYRLWRVWDPGLPRVGFVMLNPSTADATQLDPTLRRCLGFARAWGCGGFEVGNLYALRSTDPKNLWRVLDPVGPGNDAALEELARACGYGVVVGWGAHAERTRADHVLSLLVRHASVMHLGLTQAGHPRHPLYLRGDLRPQRWRARRAA